MTELSAKARALIETARAGDDPTPQARARGDAAVRVALAMHGVTDLPVLGPGPSAVPGPAPSPTLSPKPGPSPSPTLHAGAGAGGLAMKVGLAAAVVLTAGMLALRPGSKVKEGAADAAMQDATAAARVPSVGSADPGADAVASRAPVDVNERAGAKAARKRGQRGRPATAGADGQAIEAEVRLISVANGLVRDRRFGEALRVLEHHERRFPRGALREERGALRVLSLCADEPDARARREGERFLRTSPRSVLAARVRAACAAP